jgi:S-DNA-T family DNA segregation ATPase FtsK/SpoIIIE
LLTSAQRSWILGLALLGVALLTLLSLLSKERGSLTGLWLDVLRRTFGWGVYVVPAGLTVLGVWVITLGTDHPLHLPLNRVLGVVLLFIVGLALSHHFLGQVEGEVAVERYGGNLGRWLSQTLSGALSWAGAIVLLVVLVGIGLTLVLNVSLAQVMADFAELVARLVNWLKGLHLPRRNRHNSPLDVYTPPLPEPQPAIPPPNAWPVERKEPATSQPTQGGAVAAVPSVTISAGVSDGAVQWTLPSVGDLLAESEETQMSVTDMREKTRVIEETLRSLGVPATVVEVNPGPAVTQFGLEPGYVERRDRDGKVKRAKVKVSRISALANDLALALAASPIRIEAPVPGKGIVGLEIPNSQTAVVGLRGVMESEQFRAISSSNLALGFGRDVSGMAVVDDLGKLPHLLIAGATGSGKSVCINALIACLLCRNMPDELKLLMIDPKRVELSNYNGIPHLLAPVVVEVDRVVGVLNWVTREMDRR